jgi:hypothetical protein
VAQSNGSSGFGAANFGFADSIGGGIMIGNFSAADYRGGLSDAPSDLHVYGFGFWNDAVAAGQGAGRPVASGYASFTVIDENFLTSVNKLLNLFSPPGDDGPAAFVVDAIKTNTAGLRTGQTELLSGVPEPSSRLFPLLVVFGVLGWVVQRSKGRAA